jgi:hypothetical protein
MLVAVQSVAMGFPFQGAAFMEVSGNIVDQTLATFQVSSFAR